MQKYCLLPVSVLLCFLGLAANGVQPNVLHTPYSVPLMQMHR